MEIRSKTKNVTLKEKKALNDLKKDQKIVVNPADKGGRVVITNKSDYNQEMGRLLGDQETYKNYSLIQ